MQEDAPPRVEQVVLANGAAVVLHVAGSGRGLAAARLRDALRSLVDPTVAHVVVDLREIEGMDTSVLGVLVAALKRLRTCEKQLTLVVTPGSAPARLLRITGLDAMFRAAETVDDALAQHYA